MPATPVTHAGEVTSWIPLTSTFTPSSGCESIFRLNGPSLVAFDPGYGLDIDEDVDCVPSAVTTWWEQARLGVGGEEHTALSIQPLICPNLWTTVMTYVTDTSTTQIMCCPSGYTNPFHTSGPVNGDCVSTVPKGMVLTYASTPYGSSNDWTIETTTAARDSSVGAIAVVGFNVARAPPTSTPSPSGGSISFSGSSFTSASPAMSTTGPSPTASGSNGPARDGGMSTGEKIGIGLGVTLGVIGTAALIFAMLLLRRRHGKRAKTPDASVPVAESEPKPMETYQHPQEYEYHISELQGHYQPHELPSQEPKSPVEMGYPGR
ncbi:uncharacterized protein J4E79_001953 [Alternaria viburni]|uniref:uncharacterized protein n=1 Tax=Alternaria viburni TaxID=566460 RepID=UPI0020C55B4C|nr:uncharacterized protein J4E79_001953 [Alternaria viburni]KAI4667268.1 hypothetical protein J4E79_001953 [Alternaria viburni]